MPILEKDAVGNVDAGTIIQNIANGFANPKRSPVLATPADLGLDYESVSFPSGIDGVPLEAWFIPRPGSDKLIIVNHPLNFNRYGCPTHVEPFLSFGAWGGNDFEVNYMEDYRILHEAGYNVITYDERNMGQSGQGNGLTSAGRFESRDVVGSINYARSRKDLKDMTVGLFSRCNGANATFFAMAEYPEAFENVRCLVAAQPLSVASIMKRSLESIGLGGYLDDLDAACRFKVGFSFAQMSPIPWAQKAVLPTFVYQVREDVMSHESDVQSIFDQIPTEKKLHWIEGTTQRWNGYLEFQRRPQPMLDWFARFMS